MTKYQDLKQGSFNWKLPAFHPANGLAHPSFASTRRRRLFLSQSTALLICQSPLDFRELFGELVGGNAPQLPALGHQCGRQSPRSIPPTSASNHCREILLPLAFPTTGDPNRSSQSASPFAVPERSQFASLHQHQLSLRRRQKSLLLLLCRPMPQCYEPRAG